MEITTLEDMREFVAESRAFQTQALQELSTLTAELRNVVKRLDTLNGSVARQQGEINELQRDAAVAAALVDAADKLEAANAAAAEKLETSRGAAAETLRKWTQPILMLIVIALCSLILLNGPALIGIK